MAKGPKIRDIPVFTKEDAGGIHRLFALLAYFFPIGTLVMWLIFRKKSKFVKMHAETCFGYYLVIIIMTVVFGVFAGVAALVLNSMGKLKDMLFVGIAMGAIGGLIVIVFLIMLLVSMIRALFGKLESNKQLKLIVREQLALGNPEAVEVIKTDARFADILAEYNATHTQSQNSDNGGSSNN